ncbi:MAG: hypothetical protein V7609_2581 [Verrucomicrobiota bacterium]
MKPGILVFALSAIGISLALATSNQEYGPNEYTVIDGGLSPDRKYSIAAHGEGELGYGNFHIYLMNAVTGKKIGPFEEIKDNLDTGADAFYAKWSRDSKEVAIRYRIDRREALEVRYQIDNGRAYLIKGPSKSDGLRFD